MLRQGNGRVAPPGKPNTADAEAHIAEFLNFIYKLRVCRKSEIVIDMQQVALMVVDATLLFKAELHYLLERYRPKIRCIPPRKNRTMQVLQQTGIGDLLGCTYRVNTTRDDVVNWRHAHGPYGYFDQKRVDNLHERIAQLPVNSQMTFRAITESITNCTEHAYLDHPERRPMRDDTTGWWVFVDVRNERLSIAVCDLGIGISRALPLKLSDEPTMLGKLMAMFKKWSSSTDVRAILAAIEYGRTSTGKKERGKGLRDAHQVIEDAGSGSFSLISNRGFYEYIKPAPDKVPVKRHHVLHKSLCGTIYLWTIFFQPASEIDASTDDNRSLQ